MKLTEFNLAGSGVYKITCIVNQKYYIGSSCELGVRIKEHVNRLIRSGHDNEHLQNAWKLYGESQFEVEVLEWVTPADLLIREQYYIDTLNACDRTVGFNKAPQAGNTLGVRFKHRHPKKPITEEHREKLRQATKKWANSPEGQLFHTANGKRLWQDQDYVKKRADSHRVATAKESFRDAPLRIQKASSPTNITRLEQLRSGQVRDPKTGRIMPRLSSHPAPSG